MEGKKTSSQSLLDIVERIIPYYFARVDKELLCYQKLKEGRYSIRLNRQKKKLDWPIRVVHEALEQRKAGEKEPKVRSVWLRHPISADNITDKGKHLTQHKYTKRGIEQVSLLEEALEETTT